MGRWESIDDLPTPCLLIERTRLDRNLREMQERAQSKGLALRPHIKSHKCLNIAKLQLGLGAIGLTSSKPEEAAIFVSDGVPELTLAFPIIDPARLVPLLQLAKTHKTLIRVIADSVQGVRALDCAAIEAKVTLEVMVKVDVGLGRVGVDPTSDEAIEVFREVLHANRLTLGGLLAHAGHAYAAGNPEGVRRVAIDEWDRLKRLVHRLIGSGIAIREISTGCTPTALIDTILPPIDGVSTTEIRPGNYVFLDLTAVRLGLAGLERIALGVLVTVVSSRSNHAVIDAGSKTLSSDQGPHGTGGDDGFGLALAPEAFLDTGPVDNNGFYVERLSEEHGILRTNGQTLPLGMRLVVLPNHACVVANLAREYVVIQHGRPEGCWPVHARALVQ